MLSPRSQKCSEGTASVDKSFVSQTIDSVHMDLYGSMEVDSAIVEICHWSKLRRRQDSDGKSQQIPSLWNVKTERLKVRL